MRRDSPYFLAVLIGALLGGVVYAGVSQFWRSPPPPAADRSAEDRPEEDRSADDRLEQAHRLMAAGRLHEAQERYLEILLTAPRDEQAMRGLVEVRRRLAGHDPVVLRQEAAWARGAIKNVRADADPQTSRRLRLIAEASALAAQEVERERAPRPVVLADRPSATRPTVTPSRPARPLVTRRAATPTRAARPQTTRAAITVARTARPPATQRRPATPRPPAVLRPLVTPRLSPGVRAAVTPAPRSRRVRTPAPQDDGSRYRVYIGPLVDEQSADRIARAVARAGYPAETVVVHDAPAFRFVVVSEPLTREMLLNGVANRRARAMAARGFRPRLQLQAAGISRFKFGEFETEEEAEALARRIRRAGYRATVLREGGIYYQVAGGPLSQRGVNAVVDLIRARFRRAAVTVTRAD